MSNTVVIGMTSLSQGTLAEKIRAAGAGIPAFYTATGVGTDHANGKIAVKYNTDGTVAEYNKKRETKVINGKEFILEEALHGDFALIKAWKGDKLGNLVFRGTARNFNPDVAKAAKVCIAEVEELVEAGEIKPEDVHLPSVFVHRIVKGEISNKGVKNNATQCTGESEANGYVIGRRKLTHARNQLICLTNKVSRELIATLCAYTNIIHIFVPQIQPARIKPREP
jgi:acyl CoA:acetate/3-ketoacid CoA transferase